MPCISTIALLVFVIRLELRKWRAAKYLARKREGQLAVLVPRA